jgi:hypothetical protein
MRSVTVTLKGHLPKAAKVRSRLTYTVTSDTTVLYRVRGMYLKYRVWFVTQWYWEAGGNSGTAPSRAMAEQLAKRWLRDGQ